MVLEIKNDETKKYSNAQAPWRLVLLSISTFTVYHIYWFYRNWKHLKKHKNLDISPGWRTVGLFIPIYNIVLIYRQFRDIKHFATASGCKSYSSPGWLTLSYIFFTILTFEIWGFGWKMTPTETSETFFGLLAVWMLVIVQQTLNSFWKKEQSELEIRTKFTNGEIALLVIGGILWILSL